MQQGVEAMFRHGIGKAHGCASLTGETAGALDIARRGQPLETRGEKFDQCFNIRRDPAFRTRWWMDETAHRTLVSAIPSISLASALII